MLKNTVSISFIFALFVFQFACSSQQRTVGDANSTSVNVAVGNATNSAAQTAANEISPSSRENLKRQATELSQTLESGDFGKIADFTHPTLVEKLGGREKIVAGSKEVIGDMKKQGMATDSVEIGEPGEIVAVNRDLFANVPLTLVLKTPKGKMKQESTLVGISSDNGANWKFVNGVNQTQFNELFPEAGAKVQISDAKPPMPVEGK